MIFRSQAHTELGRASKSNDNLLGADDRLGVWFVVDGIGDHGQVAAQTVSGIFEQRARRLQEVAQGDDRRKLLELMQNVFLEASVAICERRREDPLIGLAVASAVLVVGSGRTAAIGHVGGCAVFQLRGAHAVKLTHDHTVEQLHIEQGLLDPNDAVAREAYGNALTRAIGEVPKVQVDTLWLDTLPGDALLLVSRGACLYTALEELSGLAVHEDAARRLVALNRQRGGAEDATAVLVRLTEEVDTKGGLAVLDSRARVEHLRNVPLFRYLTDGEMVRVLRIVYETRYQLGEVIVQEGAAGGRIYVVCEGTLEVSKEGVALTRLETGRYFGEVSFVDEGARSATVRAVTPARLLSVARSDFDALGIADSGLAFKLSWALAQNVALRLRELSADYVAQSRRLKQQPPT